MLPKTLTAHNGKVGVRALPKGAARALPRGVARSPKYINPSPAPSVGICQTPVLDIYVDGVWQPAIDGLGEQPDSLCVQATADGTQTVNIPLYSTNSNQIVVVEWDAYLLNVLAIGEADYGTFGAGSTINVSLTMQMNAYYIGITDLGFNYPAIMSGTYGLPCPPTAQFGVFTADANQTFVPVAGYGGTSTPSLTSGPPIGTTTLAQSAIPGIYNVVWDGSCDSLNVSASAPNPAYQIVNDVYYNGGYNYPGIANLYYGNYPSGGGSFDNWFDYQLDYPTVTGSTQIQNNS